MTVHVRATESGMLGAVADAPGHMRIAADQPVEHRAPGFIRHAHSTEPISGSLPQLPDPVFPMVPVDADRYGWDQSVQDRRTASEVAHDEAKARKREAKWVRMIKNFEGYFGKKPRKVKERMKKGIPDAMRGRVWAAILGVDQLVGDISIATAYAAGVPVNDAAIKADVPRTLPMNPAFQTEAKQTSLYRILRAYANSDRALGYAQGMGFHAGILLCYLDEERAFRAFYQLFMKGGARNLFCDGFRGLRRAVAVFDALLEKRVPRVHAHLRARGLKTTRFAPAWLLTSFIAADLPLWVVLRIYDCFVLFGVRAAVSFGVAICKCEEDRLLAASTELLPILESPWRRMECMSRPYEVIAEWRRLWVTDEEWTSELREVDAGIFAM